MPMPDTREIATLVPMARLIVELGFEVNERTRRAPCPLHSGSNPTSFSWTDSGLWKCQSCGAGGDRIALVRAVKQCSFRDAVGYLAELAGVPVHGKQRTEAEIEQAQRERQLLRRDAESLLEIEKAAWLEGRDVVLQLEGIRRNAGERLQAMHRGGKERWPGEMETLWFALAEVYRQMANAAAAYNVISFAPHTDRLAFAVDPQARDRLINDALECGYVADERGYRFEVIL
jgi:hypothetical protein